jgi:hypothetical protein
MRQLPIGANLWGHQVSRVGLLVVERMNAITMKRAALIAELQRREGAPPHPKVGAWRHEYNLEGLRLRIALLERRRMLMFERETPH